MKEAIENHEVSSGYSSAISADASEVSEKETNE